MEHGHKLLSVCQIGVYNLVTIFADADLTQTTTKENGHKPRKAILNSSSKNMALSGNKLPLNLIEKVELIGHQLI